MSSRYCSSCRLYKPADGANVRNQYGKVVRWRCKECNIRALTRCDEIHNAKSQDGNDDKKTGE